MTDIMPRDEVQKLLDAEPFDAFGAAEQVGALKAECAVMPGNLKRIGDVLVDMTEKVVKDKIATDKTIRGLARSLLAAHDEIDRLRADALAAQALLVERAAEACEDVDFAHDNPSVQRMVREVIGFAGSRVRALAHDTGVKALAELRAERDALERIGKEYCAWMNEEKARADKFEAESYERGVAMAATEAERDDLRARLAEAEGQVKALTEALEACVGSLERANTEEGVCCCGDSMDGHSDPMSCGHSPVDMGNYYAGMALDAARAALSPAGEAAT